MLQARLDFLAEKTNVVTSTELGFRKGFGTANCQAVLFSHIVSTFAKKSMYIAVFLDITADDVVIDILCDIFNDYKFPKKVVKQ